VQIKTDQSDNAKVTVNGNRSLAFQTCSSFHMECVVFGRPLVIEFFASGKLVIRMHFQVYDQITDGQFHAQGRSAVPLYDFSYFMTSSI
jgi:hypothetical protein